MNIIDHGKWVAYTPANIPVGAPPNTLFAKRESDGVDWYTYVRNFSADTVKFMAAQRDYASGYVVGPAVRDATMLFPAGHIVGEIVDYVGGDPQEEFRNKLFDPKTRTFTDWMKAKANG